MCSISFGVTTAAASAIAAKAMTVRMHHYSTPACNDALTRRRNSRQGEDALNAIDKIVSAGVAQQAWR
jgi:hypothetical protein